MALTALVFGVLLWLVNRAQSQGTGECQFNDNGYNLRWKVDDQNNVHFDFQFDRFPSDNRWTGIAFGNSMNSGLDAIIIKSFNGRVTVSDQSVLGYAPAVPDRINNVDVQSAQLEQGALTARFSRPLAAGDPENDHDIRGCTNWQFVTNANILDGGGNIRQHTTRPVTQKICPEECRGEPAAGFGRPPPRGAPGIAGPPNEGPSSGGLPIVPVPIRPINPVPSASVDCPRPDGEWCRDYISNFSQWSNLNGKAAKMCSALKSIIPMCCEAYHEQCS